MGVGNGILHRASSTGSTPVDVEFLSPSLVQITESDSFLEIVVVQWMEQYEAELGRHQGAQLDCRPSVTTNVLPLLGCLTLLGLIGLIMEWWMWEEDGPDWRWSGEPIVSNLAPC